MMKGAPTQTVEEETATKATKTRGGQEGKADSVLSFERVESNTLPPKIINVRSG